MQRPLNLDVNFESYQPPALQQRSGLITGRHRTDKGSNSFHHLLRDRMDNLGAACDRTESVLPLERKNLLSLVETIQIQMNDFFFSELSDYDDDTIFDGFQLDWVTPWKIDTVEDLFASKVQHRACETKADRTNVNFATIIDRASDTYGIDADLIKAVIRAESNFDPDCTSPKGAMGLMQLMPETARELRVENPFDPTENIMAGTRYFRRLINRYEGDIPVALAAYNWGMGNIERHPEKLPKETKDYILRVNTFFNNEKSYVVSARK